MKEMDIPVMIDIPVKKLNDVCMIQVIRTTLLARGAGIPENPFRKVEQFWSLDGELLAENDPYLGEGVTESKEE